MVIMITIIRYTDEEKLKNTGLPMIIYGRRKTGKTFLVKRIFGGDNYLFVKRDRSIYWESEDTVINYQEMMRLILREDDEIFIVDEFHRLPDEFLDFIHIKNPKNLVLVTSTLWLAERMLSSSSPLLGLFSEYRMDIIDERDILRNLAPLIKDKKKLVEQAVYMREPILLRYFGSEIYKVLPQLKLTIPALIGEIFLEEDKEFSARYEGVIRAIASGKRTLTEITQFLHSNSLIPKQDSSLIKPYLKILQSMGIIWRFPEFNVKRHRYFIPSPIIDTYYYLDEKYNFSERELHQKYFEERVPMHVEMFFRTLLAKIFNYRIFLYQKPAEIDIVLGDFRKIKFVGEVKWKSSVDKKDIKKAEEKLAKFRARRVLIVPDKSEISAETKEIEVWDIEDILKMI